MDSLIFVRIYVSEMPPNWRLVALVSFQYSNSDFVAVCQARSVPFNVVVRVISYDTTDVKIDCLRLKPCPRNDSGHNVVAICSDTAKPFAVNADFKGYHLPTFIFRIPLAVSVGHINRQSCFVYPTVPPPILFQAARWAWWWCVVELRP